MDHRVLKHAVRVDDIKAAKSDISFLDQDVVRASELTADVRRERVTKTLDAILVPRGLDPCTMRMDRVGRDTDDLGSDAVQFVKAIRKGSELGRAHKCEIKRVKQKHQPLALVVRQFDVLGQGFHILGRRHVKIRCRLADLGQCDRIFRCSSYSC